MRRTRAVVVGTAGAILLAASVTGCGPDASGKAASSASPTPASPSPTATLAPTATPTATPTAAATATPASEASPTTRVPASRTAPPPSKTATSRPVPTYLAMRVAAPGGGLTLKAGGAAQEFTVTLRNGNTRAYRHLALALQMEIMPGATADPAYRLERWDASAGAWRAATLRIANDTYPYELVTGGTALAKDAVATHRYRIRAAAGAAPGPDPIMISLIDTDADTRVQGTSLPQTTLAP